MSWIARQFIICSIALQVVPLASCRAPVVKQNESLRIGPPCEVPSNDPQAIATEGAYTLIVNAKGEVLKAGDNKPFLSMLHVIEDLKHYKAQSDKQQRTPVVVIAADGNTRLELEIQVRNAIRAAGIMQYVEQIESNPAPPEETATP